MRHVRCAFCGRLTLKPAAYIGEHPVGSTCAKRHNLVALATAGRGLVRKADTSKHHASTAKRDGRTRDLFEGAQV